MKKMFLLLLLSVINISFAQEFPPPEPGGGGGTTTPGVPDTPIDMYLPCLTIIAIIFILYFIKVRKRKSDIA